MNKASKNGENLLVRFFDFLNILSLHFADSPAKSAMLFCFTSYIRIGENFCQAAKENGFLPSSVRLQGAKIGYDGKGLAF